MKISNRTILRASIVVIVGLLSSLAFKSNKTDIQLSKREKDAVYEETIVPTKHDTDSWNTVRLRYSKARLSGYTFFISCIQLVRGLADTSKFNDANYDNIKIDRDLKAGLCFSPLVIKGKVLKRGVEDTTNCRRMLQFRTNYTIEIEKIYKSKYKNLQVGDKVLAKVDLYGLYKSCEHNKILMVSGDVMEYTENESYFFCLDRYAYMMKIYALKDSVDENGIKEQYDPCAFSIPLMSHDLSEAYIKKEIQEQEIINYFKN